MSSGDPKDPRPGLRKAVCCGTCAHFKRYATQLGPDIVSWAGPACTIAEPPAFYAESLTCDAHKTKPKEPQ